MFTSSYSSEYETVRLSDEDLINSNAEANRKSVKLSLLNNDRKLHKQIKIRNNDEIRDYHSNFRQIIISFFTSCLNCSFFKSDDDDFYKNYSQKNKSSSIEFISLNNSRNVIDTGLLTDEDNHITTDHLKMLDYDTDIYNQKVIHTGDISSDSKKKKKKKSKRNSNNEKPYNDVEDEINLPEDSMKEEEENSSSSSFSDYEIKNNIKSKNKANIVPQTPVPIKKSSSSSSSSSSSDDNNNVKIKEEDIDHDNRNNLILHFKIDDESPLHHDEKMISISNIKIDVVSKTISYINIEKQKIINLKEEYNSMRYRHNKNKNDGGISYDKKIELITDLINWCDKVINDMLSFSKKINSYKNKENLYFTYDIIDYCKPVRDYFEQRQYLKYLKQDDNGKVDLLFIKDLPLIIQK